jgi:hypothetical protein
MMEEISPVRSALILAACASVAAACGGRAHRPPADPGLHPDDDPATDEQLIGGDGDAPGAGDGGTDAAGEEPAPSDGAGDAPGDTAPATFVAVTFNTGIHPTVGVNGFTAEQDEYLDTYYGHGLAWGPAIAEAQRFFAEAQPDLVAFQELFDIAECAAIPEPARQGFVCEGWTPEAPTVAERILGPGYQVACHWHKSDKCAAVKLAFGSFRGCAAPTCFDGLFGSTVPDCGSGARVGRGVVDLQGGGTLTVVSIHASSGQTGDDMECRSKQVDQVFVDVGDGAPAANGTPNLVLGDFNTDPRNLAVLLVDESARRWTDFVGPGLGFAFVNEHVNTYSGLLCIDNVVSDALSGSCWSPGYFDGHPALSADAAFDHTPTVCTLARP